MTDKLDAPHPGLRVYVDGSEHPIHDNVQSMGARLLLDNGDIAEVQIARIGDTLNIVVAGEVQRGVRDDGRGNTIIQVYPTAKVPT